MSGRSVEEYGSPLFLAWQLTNHCDAACLACCEESGRGNAWPDELGRNEALSLAKQIIDLGIPYVAFGGGEPLSVSHCWDLFELLADAGVGIKLETNGRLIDDVAASRLHTLGVQCVQISVDDAVRPPRTIVCVPDRTLRRAWRRDRPAGDPRHGAAARLRSHKAQHSRDRPRLRAGSALRLRRLGHRTTERLGRAAAAWGDLACDDAAWRQATKALRERAAEIGARTALHIYPWISWRN